MRRFLLGIAVLLVAAISLIRWEQGLAGGGLALTGCEHPQAVNAGESFDITFYFTVLEPIKKDCSLFIHLLSKGTMINSDVSLPYPASQWKTNQVVKVGPFRVEVPVDIPAGDCSIEAGLFWSEQTAFGPRYHKIPYLNYPRIKEWQVGSLQVSQPLDRNLSPEGKENHFSIYIQDCLTKVFPEKPYFLGEAKEEIHLSAARNEFESVQVSLAAINQELKEVEFIKKDLTQENGSGLISQDRVKIFLVEYASTKKPYYNTHRVGLWPDPLVPLKGSLDIEKGRFKTFWLQIYVPPDTPAGKYLGEIVISCADKDLTALNISLMVWDFALPDRASLKTAFGLRENLLYKYYSKMEK